MNAYQQRWAPPHNPDVEAQRPGFCLYDDHPGVFLTSFRVMPSGRIVTSWSTVAAEARVFATLEEAKAISAAGGEVVTVPRWNGHTREWCKVAP
jgi:hypothetical protein